MPRTTIIGTEEFDRFIRENRIYDRVSGRGHDFENIKMQFMNGRLSEDLLRKLRAFLEQADRPLAIRSSSLSEDSFTQPFAGVFHTYIIPNRKDRKELTLQKIEQAVKLVFASVFSEKPGSISRPSITGLKMRRWPLSSRSWRENDSATTTIPI